MMTPKNNDEICFENALAVLLIMKKIKSHLDRMKKLSNSYSRSM